MRAIQILILLFISISLCAQEKTFVKEYTYQASEIDSKVSSRAIATNQLRIILLNEVGVYVESESLLRTSDLKGKFSQDFVETISTISAGITNLTILDERWDGKTFWMKASITVDKTELEQSLIRVINDRQKVKELEALKIELDKAKKELAALTQELNSGNSKNQNASIESKYNEKIDVLNSIELVLRGMSKAEAMDYRGAIADYSRAIEKEPNNAIAYMLRAVSKSVTPRPHGEQLDHLGAINDYTKAIEIEPDNAWAYRMRGLSKTVLENYWNQ